MCKRILVTGAAGFIGSHLCDRLIEKVDSQGHRLNYDYDAVGNLARFDVTVGTAS